MFATVLVALMLLVPQAGKPVALPDTPQGKHVKAYLDAFNTGDEKKYLAMVEEHFDPSTVKDRSLEERAKMFQRLKGDFGTLKVTKVAKASAEGVESADALEWKMVTTISHLPFSIAAA